MSIQFCVYLQLSKKCPEESISYVSMTDQQYEKMDQIYHLRQMIRSISIQGKLHKHTFIYSITDQKKTFQTFGVLLFQEIIKPLFYLDYFSYSRHPWTHGRKWYSCKKKCDVIFLIFCNRRNGGIDGHNFIKALTL